VGSPLRWTVYYEPEGWKDPSVEEIRSDLTYLRDHYAKHPAFYRVGGKFVVFVWGIGSCADAARWNQANTVGAYLVLKLFGGYTACPSQPEAWHEYSGSAQSPHSPDSFTVSPGFWQWNQATPRLARDISRFKGNVRNMVASNARFQLIVSFNEWGEGTATESAAEWASPSGTASTSTRCTTTGASRRPHASNARPDRAPSAKAAAPARRCRARWRLPGSRFPTAGASAPASWPPSRCWPRIPTRAARRALRLRPRPARRAPLSSCVVRDSGRRRMSSCGGADSVWAACAPALMGTSGSG
jgi:hypothetical protein